MLNARQHEQEAKIVADAGNWRGDDCHEHGGRGTDIKLGGNVEFKVMEAIAADPDGDHDAIRARSRQSTRTRKRRSNSRGPVRSWAPNATKAAASTTAARPGRPSGSDPGRSSFFLSLEDDLMRIFGSERLDSICRSWGEGRRGHRSPLGQQDPGKGAGQGEGRNFDIRKTAVAVRRRDERPAQGESSASGLEIMQAADLSEIATDMRHQVIDDMVDEFMPPKTYPDAWDLEGLKKAGASG